MLLGLLLYFISTYYIFITNWKETLINFILKHSGISLIYLILNVFVNSAEEFGIENKNVEIHKSFKSKSDHTSNQYFITKSSNTFDMEINFDLNYPRKDSTHSKFYDDSVMKSELRAKKLYFNMERNYNNYLKSFIIYPCFILLLILIVIFNGIKNNSITLVQNENHNWHYKSPLENYDLTLNILEIFVFSLMLIKLKLILKYECIFNIIKSIYIALILIMTLGPFINVSIIYI